MDFIIKIKNVCKWLKPTLGLMVLFNLSSCFLQSAPEGMVLIPSGEFTMGTDAVDKKKHALSIGLAKPWFADESPERRVDVQDFYIDKYEVTNRQYYIFCQATDHKPPRLWGGQKYPEGDGNLPVTHVSFFDASAYALWVGKRLPTEAEWEKAARGPKGNIFPWGNNFNWDAANISHSSKKRVGHQLKPVGSFPEGASPYGVHDMIGNAWEWVWEYYLPYPNSEYESKDFGKKYVVVRGLSYLGVGHFPKKSYKKVVTLKARASYRERLNPFVRKKDVGFRCAKDKPPLFKKATEKKREI
ncbi:MAG: formylglycine-generating enzyme family protein [Nitrospinae bacterium]|nr:formylglycine-generating enzyme family protein [Nitrospinota bacterium]